MKKINVSYVRIALISVALILVVTGIILNEHTSVLQKSIRICLECIGIG